MKCFICDCRGPMRVIERVKNDVFYAHIWRCQRCGNEHMTTWNRLKGATNGALSTVRQ